MEGSLAKTSGLFLCCMVNLDLRILPQRLTLNISLLLTLAG
jgi:hypothetical protein